jgi:large subunit ribosomal protein L25
LLNTRLDFKEIYMSEQKLAAEVRTEFGKGFARRARMANLIPAVIYGHGAEPIHITLPAKATTLAVRTANALLSLDVNGEEHLALVKDVQRDPIRQIIEHIDLLTVIKGEKVTVDIPVHLVGELAPGNVYNQELTVISLEAEATHLPTAVEVSIEGRTCVLIDDMIDTGGTISGAVQVLKNAGAKDVIIAATHAVFSDPAARRLAESGAREVVVTDTLPIPADKRFAQLTVLSIAPLIARAIREVFDDGSVTSLFDGNA